MGQMTISIIFAANTLIRAAHFNTVHVTDIRDTYNVHDAATTGVHGLTGGAVFVGTTMSQTLTNKTLTSPVLGGTVTGTYTLGGTPTITAPAISNPVLSGSATGTYTLAGTPTITSPSISNPVFSGTATGTYALAGTPTITSPTISNPAMSGTINLGAGAVAVTLNSTTNALNFDSNTLVIDALNNRVGINTAAPAKKFQINASAADEEMIRLVGFTTGTSMLRLKLFNSDLTRAFEMDGDFTSGAEQFLIQSDTTTCMIISRNGQMLLPATDPPTANYATRDSFIRGWACINSDGSQLADYNVASISKGATGRYTVNWDRDFSSANYAVVATCEKVGGLGGAGRTCNYAPLAAGSSTDFGLVRITDGTEQDGDLNVIAAGVQ